MGKLKRFLRERTANAPLQGYGYIVLLLGVFLIAMEFAHIFMTYLDVTKQIQSAIAGCVEKAMVDEDRSHGVLTLDADAALEELSSRIAQRGLAQSGAFLEDEVIFADPNGNRSYRVRISDAAVETGGYPLTDKYPSVKIKGYIDIAFMIGGSVTGGLGSISLPFTLSATNSRIDYNGNPGWEWDGAYYLYLVDADGVIHVCGCPEAETALLTGEGTFVETVEKGLALREGNCRCTVCNPD